MAGTDAAERKVENSLTHELSSLGTKGSRELLAKGGAYKSADRANKLEQSDKGLKPRGGSLSARICSSHQTDASSTAFFLLAVSPAALSSPARLAEVFFTDARSAHHEFAEGTAGLRTNGVCRQPRSA